MNEVYKLVSNECLILRLKVVNLGEKMINSIQRMYENTTLRIRIKSKILNLFRY